MPLSHYLIAVMAIVVSGTGALYAQGFPDKPIRIVTAEAGGGSDFTARLIAQGISGPLGQPVLVDNRPSGLIPIEIVSKAPANGHTLLLYNNIFWLGPLMQTMPYDALKDFAPITLVGDTPSILVVNSSLPVKSVAELIALAKAKPGTLNYASTGTGSSNHLSAELFKSMAGVNLERIGYKGGSAALNAIIAGEVQLMFVTVVAGAPYVKSGRIRALAVTSAEASALAPGMTTMAASGLPGYESITIFGTFAPVRTPQAIIGRLNQETAQFLMTDVKEKLFNAGVETIGGPPQQLAATIKGDMARMGKVIRNAGIRAD